MVVVVACVDEGSAMDGVFSVEKEVTTVEDEVSAAEVGKVALSIKRN